MKRSKKLSAIILALALMVVSIINGRVQIMATSYTGITINVSFHEGSSSLGKVYYSPSGGGEGSWVEITDGSATGISTSDGVLNDMLHIKIVPNGGYEVDWTGVQLNGATISDADRNSLISAGGLTLTAAENATFSLSNVEFKAPEGDPPPSGPGPEGGDPAPAFEYTIKVGASEATGVEYTEVKNGDVISGDFDFDNFAFWITKATDVNDGRVFDVTNMGSNSTVRDSQNRNPLEVRLIAQGDNYLTIGWEYHPGDPEDYNPGTPAFGINQVTFCNEGFVGVAVDIGAIPDMYDDTVYSNIVDIAAGTEASPVKTGVFYGSDYIDLSALEGATSVTKVELASGVNPGAVTIVGSKVTFNSPFFASIPLKVTLSDGTVGYVTVDRIGIELRDYSKDKINTLHGSQTACPLSGVEGRGERNIIATFYYDAAESYEDYNIVAKLFFADGSMKTVVVAGFDEMVCKSNAGLKGGDYLIWSGAQSERPVKVSATAIKRGATSGDTFGGACFGAGNGVTLTFE